MKTRSVIARLCALVLVCGACAEEPDGAIEPSVPVAPHDDDEEGLSILSAEPDHLVATYREGETVYRLETQVDQRGKEWVMRNGDREVLRFRSDETLYELSFLDGSLTAKGRLADTEPSEVTGDPETVNQLDNALIQRFFGELRDSDVDVGMAWPAPPGVQALSNGYYCGAATMCVFALLLCQDRYCEDHGCPIDSETYPCGICVGFPTGFFPPVAPPHFPNYCH